MPGDTLKITVDFGGGTELLTAPPHLKKHVLQIPAQVSGDAADTKGSISKQNGPASLIPTVTSPSSSSSSSNNLNSSDKPSRPADMFYLISYIKTHLIVERPELFVDADGKSVRPGILVLINDADWELEGEGSYVLQDGDEVSFISTLHGG